MKSITALFTAEIAMEGITVLVRGKITIFRPHGLAIQLVFAQLLRLVATPRWAIHARAIVINVGVKLISALPLNVPITLPP